MLRSGLTGFILLIEQADFWLFMLIYRRQFSSQVQWRAFNLLSFLHLCWSSSFFILTSAYSLSQDIYLMKLYYYCRKAQTKFQVSGVKNFYGSNKRFCRWARDFYSYNLLLFTINYYYYSQTYSSYTLLSLSYFPLFLFYFLYYILFNYMKNIPSNNTQLHLKYDFQQKKDLIGKIKFHEQLNVDGKNRGIQPPTNKRVFILLTGGTIGMFPNQDGKYAPSKNRFVSFLNNYPYFCDEDQTYFNGNDGFIITPPSIANYPISYKYFQLDHLIDSTNMSLDRINTILGKIEEVYNDYDAFVILHGTDTLAYTASALSFMIQNLKKTIVITGAQIPMGQPRNDAVNNLLSSLTIAGHYSIPQVLVIFDNKILRGNRTTKFSTSSFEAFKSPNFYPIGQLGLQVTIKWEKIFPCNSEAPSKFIRLKENIEIQKLTPFGFKTTPSSKYIVIESFGIGNIPTQGAFYEWALENSKLPKEQRKILVNISQVYQSVIKNTYETGQMAFKLGMIPGSDMTCQAAISKLSYLVSKGYKEFEDLNTMMCKNLRGELTQQEDRFTKQKQNYILNSMTILDRHFIPRTQKEKNILIQVIFQTILLQKPSKIALNRFQQYKFNPHQVFPDGTNWLHRLMKMNHSGSQVQYGMILEMLLNLDIEVNLIDASGNSACFYGIQNGNYLAVTKIVDNGGLVKTTSKRIFRALAEQDISLLHGLAKFQDKFEYKNTERRNCAFISIIKRNEKLIQFFKQFTHLFDEEGLKQKDIYGNTLQYYAKKLNIASVLNESQSRIKSPRNSPIEIKKSVKDILPQS